MPPEGEGSQSNDVERSKYFESLGYRVVRFWNDQMENGMDGVIQGIEMTLEPGKTK
jgi:very-short-patch-repair endonuclease